MAARFLRLKSTDAVTWTVTSGSPNGANDLAVNKSVWVMATVGAYGGGVHWSADKGVTWNPVAVGNHRVATAGYKRVILGDKRFIAVHADGTAGGLLEFALSLRSP